MSYTINPNAKNKWARNAENTMDLSLETDASSVYLDNGRTLEQEIGEGSMVSNVVTVDSAMSKVIDGTLDGAYESLVFKGKSLVNLMTSCKDETLIEYCNPPANSNVANVSMIKPNTVYTIIYSAKYQEEGNRGHLIVRTQQDGGDINVSSGFTFGTTYKRFAYKFTTPSTIDYFVLRSNGHYFHVKEVMLLEGDYINVDLPYFEGLCDVKMPILHNVGKNLFDINGDINQKFSYMAGGSGNVILGANSFRADSYSYDHHGKGVILNLKPNTTYTISGHVENFGNVNFMTGGWNPRHRIVKANGYFETTYTPADNEVETCISFVTFSTSSDPKAIFSNIQIEESSTPTTYEDHKTNILHTSEEIILREVNGVQDTYNPLTGEYVRRIGEIVLDGSDDEKWTLGNWWTPQVETMGFEMPLPTKGDSSLTDKLIHGQFNTITSTDIEYLGVSYQWQCLGVRIKRSKLSTEDIAGLKMYLSQNPITVQYELAEPITTIVESLTTPFAYENGHVILESGHEGQSLLPTLEYSTVVNKTGLVENVAKTIQRQEKQLTMLEKMLIQNIINLDYNNTLLTLKNEMEEML